MVDRFFRPFFQGIFLSTLNLQSSRMFEFVFKMFTIGRNDDKVNILSSFIWWYRRFWVQMTDIMWQLIWYGTTMMLNHSRWYNVITLLIYSFLFIYPSILLFSYTLCYPCNFLLILSIHLSFIFPSTYLLIHLSMYLFFHISQYIYSSINKFIDSSVHLFIYNDL